MGLESDFGALCFCKKGGLAYGSFVCFAFAVFVSSFLAVVGGEFLVVLRCLVCLQVLQVGCSSVAYSCIWIFGCVASAIHFLNMTREFAAILGRGLALVAEVIQAVNALDSG
ncbi:hypothetical protein U1Q18_010297 [Sarracenia purpurea var. burkii]